MVSTITPKPAVKTVDPQSEIVTVLDPAPFAIVTVPVFGVRVLAISRIDIKVPGPSFTSGLVVGKLVSLAIGTKPPTSSTRSTIRASIAPVVAT